MKKYSTRSTHLNRWIKAFFGGFLLLSFTACSDYLTIYPTNAVVMENYWKEKADVEAMVANCYRTMAQSSVAEYMLVWGELRSDNVTEGTLDAGNYRNINEANLLPTNGFAQWGDFYGIINNCNIVLKFAPEVMELDPDYTEGDYLVHKGEMLALRALCHFYLVRAFRDIPLQVEAIIDDSQELYQPQVSPIEALDQILADLYEAEELVMESGSYISVAENKGRITRDAVRATIADVLLWKAAFTQYAANGNDEGCDQYYTECIEYCDAIINARKEYLTTNKDKLGYDDLEEQEYPIVPSFSASASASAQYSGNPAYQEIFGIQNSVAESIFELQIGRSGNVEENNYFITKNFGRGTNISVAGFVATAYLSNSADGSLYPKTDIRRVSFMDLTDGEEEPALISKYLSTNFVGVFSPTGTNSSIGIPVYRSIQQQNDNTKGYHEQYYMTQCNWIIYRITDVMLMKAEALAHRNDSTQMDLDKAFPLVQAVYYRSNNRRSIADADTLTYTKGDANSMQDLILKERQREFAFEGKRWFDLVRKALRDGSSTATVEEFVKNKYTSNHKSYINKMPTIDYLFFPIAEREINTNPLLKQNPAYETLDMFDKN
ncbi:MAG: RagB/SusD family nutrient uptake outer membrane protein [Bacteroidales bacterium]|nr:RagB/SusD family nutrient uptake outer membrane protein [Bacteroidales bacterium]